MAIKDLTDFASKIAEEEKRFRESEARRVILECEVSARGYEIEAMYNSLLEQEKIHIEQINLLQQIVDHIPMPIFWKDTDGFVLGCNHACEVILDETKSNIVGKTIFDLFHTQYADIYNEADMIAYKDGKYSFTTTFKKSSGEEVVAILHMKVYYDCAYERKGLIIFAHTPCDGSLCP